MELRHIEQSYGLIPKKKYFIVLPLFIMGYSQVQILHFVSLPIDRTGARDSVE
jgi:hypothetical protein